MQNLVIQNFPSQNDSCVSYKEQISVIKENRITITSMIRTYGNKLNLSFVDPNVFFQNLLHPIPSYTPDMSETITGSTTPTIKSSPEATQSVTQSESGTVSITAIATYSPIASPSSTASIRPSFTTSLAPTFSSTPTKLFPNVFPEHKVPITAGGNYSSTSANEHYVINTTAIVEITCGIGKSQFTLFNNPGAKLIIHNFLPQNGTINLSNIQGISNYVY
jgi:hypothetical protein